MCVLGKNPNQSIIWCQLEVTDINQIGIRWHLLSMKNFGRQIALTDMFMQTVVLVAFFIETQPGTHFDMFG